MTQEEKQLLLKDLCARLPYGVKCHFKYGSAEDDITLSCIDNCVARFEYGWYGSFHVSIDADYIKPYLRPISSMTEEEDKRRIELGIWRNSNIKGCKVTAIDKNVDKALDWLNAHHFDYRGLIEKGLAIEVTEENNPYKE